MAFTLTLQILRDTFIAFFVIFFSFSTHAMGDRPEVDPQCFVSDKLRVEIGGEKYEFPRKMVRSMSGKNIVHANPHYKKINAVEGSKACQKPEDDLWKLDSVSLDIVPRKCVSKKDCNASKVFLRLYNQSSFTNTNHSERTPNNTSSLIKDCTKTNKKFASKSYGLFCDYYFRNDDLFVVIKFYSGLYPPEKIDQTVQIALREVQKHEIKN